MDSHLPVNSSTMTTSSSNLVLYSFWQSSCSWRVRFALNLRGLPYEYKAVDLSKGEQFSPEFEQINPLHFVPALVDDGVVVADSLAILLYLEDRYPENPLLPVDPRLKVLNLQVASIVSSSIQPLHMLTVLNYFEGKIGNKDTLSWAQLNIEKGFNALEKLLKNFAGRYSTGDEVCMADVFVAPQIATAVKRFHIDMGKFPTLSRVYESCKDLPEFQAASPDRQPDAEVFVEAVVLAQLVENGASNGSLARVPQTSSLDNDDVKGTDGGAQKHGTIFLDPEPQAIDVWPKKLQPFDGNGQELNPLDDKTRDLGPLESKTQVDLESSTDLEVPQESECVHLEAHGGTEFSNSKFTNQTNVAVENGHHEPTDRSQVEEPPTPHKLEAIEGETEKCKDISVEICEQDVRNDSLVLSLELNEAKKIGFPILLLQWIVLIISQEASPHGKKGMGTQESVDGSILSKSKGSNQPSEPRGRHCTHCIFELEEERNAAAIAANQTMAMIKWLREEKATMQMEALHYQRMMEEQAKYDQKHYTDERYHSKERGREVGAREGA
ncbi:hypothetical protein Nepgr_023515 [Nepenthes gracilis]|uniref:glutathione transferase n=1 Tax=Nepenthes gracilis TaxID=150966 RepID=A0AAD3XXY1_NEPGR|nr:hypothetical protein Nepgr_023515 [Nepenthes gracilis]